MHVFWPIFYTAISIAIVLNINDPYMEAAAFVVLLPLRLWIATLERKAMRRSFAREIQRQLQEQQEEG